MSGNAELIREFFAAFSAGDLDRLRAGLSPSVTWTTNGASLLAGTRRGPDEVIAHLRRSGELSDGTYGVDVQDVLTSDLGAAVVYTGSGTRNGSAFRFEAVLHYVIEHGLITKITFAPFDPAAFDQAWS